MIYSTEDFKVSKLSLLQRKKDPPQKGRMNYLKILSEWFFYHLMIIWYIFSIFAKGVDYSCSDLGYWRANSQK